MAATRSVLSHHTLFSKLKAKRARVFAGVLEHIKPGKIGARIEGHIDNCRCYRHGDNLTRLRWVDKFQGGRV